MLPRSGSSAPAVEGPFPEQHAFEIEVALDPAQHVGSYGPLVAELHGRAALGINHGGAEAAVAQGVGLASAIIPGIRLVLPDRRMAQLLIAGLPAAGTVLMPMAKVVDKFG